MPWQVSCLVSEAINNWFAGLASVAVKPVFGLAGTLLSTPDLSSPAMARAQSLWFADAAIADTCFVLLVVLGGLVVMGGHAVAPGTASKDIVSRLFLAFAAANSSKLLIDRAIQFTNALATALLSLGRTKADPQVAVGLLEKMLMANLATNGALTGLAAMIVLVAVVLALIVAAGYIVRISLVMVLIVAAPLALACHALLQTDGVARLWWRAITGMLAIQAAQALVFATAMDVLLPRDGRPAETPVFGMNIGGGILDLLLVVCLLYILVRIPSWVSKSVWRGQFGRNPLTGVGRFLLSVIVVRRVSAALTGRTAGGAARRATPPARQPVYRSVAAPAAGPSPLAAAAPGGRPVAPAPGPGAPQPRWAHPSRQWTPPGPYGPVQPNLPDPTSPGQQQRWGNPATTWTPPYAGPWQGASPSQRPRRPAPPPTRTPPNPNRPWTPPDPSPRRNPVTPPGGSPAPVPKRTAPPDRQKETQPKRRPDPNRPWTTPR
jgi:hypothetical protein